MNACRFVTTGSYNETLGINKLAIVVSLNIFLYFFFFFASSLPFKGWITCYNDYISWTVVNAIWPNDLWKTIYTDIKGVLSCKWSWDDCNNSGNKMLKKFHFDHITAYSYFRQMVAKIKQWNGFEINEKKKSIKIISTLCQKLIRCDKTAGWIE